MLRRVEIENFKGVGERVSLDLKPVTLLFGPNSAGKSTLLHAIHYAHAILEEADTSPTTTPLGGRGLDLGGFPSLVHNHDLLSEVRLAFEYDVDGLDFEEYLVEPFERTMLTVRAPADSGDDEGEWDDVLQRGIGGFQEDQVRTARLELTIRWSPVTRSAVVTAYDVHIDGLPLARVEASNDGADVWLTAINANHPALHNQDDETELVTQDEHEGRTVYRPVSAPDQWFYRLDKARAREHAIRDVQAMLDGITGGRWSGRFGCLQNRMHALPWWNRPLGVVWGDEADAHADWAFVARLDALMVGAGGMLKNLLGRQRYVGPVRPAPSRSYRPPARLRESRWATGIGAWDKLAQDKVLRMAVSHWLDRMKSPYVLDWDDGLVLPKELHEELLRIAAEDDLNEVYQRMTESLNDTGRLVLRTERGLALAPCDLGEGITWVIPVLAAAIGDLGEAQARLVVIEQPELHIHPRMQVELGDLLLLASQPMAEADDRRQFIIETHSEHLVLRILRRIRETTDGELEDSYLSATTDSAVVLHVSQNDGQVCLKELRLTADGDFDESWPDGFFEERAEELF